MNHHHCCDASIGGPDIRAWPTRPGEKLRPHKGGNPGDGGAGDRERERQARIEAATAKVNEIFNTGNRDELYAEQKGAVYDLNRAEVDRQATETARANRFALARTGLAGGSVDAESHAELNRRTNEGLMRAGSIADQAAADLKVQDERTRSNLISMAQSGIDSGSAATMALEGLKANAATAANNRAGATVGGLFDDLSQAYLFNQIGKGRAAGMAAVPGMDQNYGVSSTRSTNSGTVTN